MADDGDDLLKQAKEEFDECVNHEADNRSAALDDLRFSRGDQWPEDVLRQRQLERRPCLTINKMRAFIRQVVNDSRQNKPSIKVHPVDSGADPETAKVISDLIRNIEYTSNADVAYDTATECAVERGWGYFRIGMDYAHGDTFDMDLSIDRVSNPFSIYGDPNSTAADSSDWNIAFATEMIPKKLYEAKYGKDAAKIDWSADESKIDDKWFTEDSVLRAERWSREEYDKKIYLMSDGTILDETRLVYLKDLLAAQDIVVVNERTAKCWKVKQFFMNGAEVLETREWLGQYIPIVPVYGDEVDVEGKRQFRSLIREAKDAQRMFNFWRSMSTELIALAPKTPFIGPKGAFKDDTEKWATANSHSHAYIEYSGQVAPQRQPFASVPAGALQEALNASDDMKAVMGIYDASLGARSNETSGRAIMARQREGDVATFHFQDNMARAIRHAGRILIDLIPHVYDRERIIRTIGEDGTQKAVPLKQETPVLDNNGKPVMGEDGVPMTRIYDLAAGKYDLTVATGPSFTTRREEAAAQMTEMVRAFPDAAPVIGDLIAKNLDWPGADEIAERLKAINPALQAQGQGGIPPELQQQIQEGMMRLQQLEQENAALKADKSVEMEKIAVDRMKTQVEAMKVQTEAAQMQTGIPMPDPGAELDLESKRLGVEKQRVELHQGERAASDDGRLSALETAIAQMHAMMSEKVAAEANETATLAEAVTKGVAAGMQSVAQAMMTPKRVVYQNNKVVGVEPMLN
jgi:hypothetical protein